MVIKAFVRARKHLWTKRQYAIFMVLLWFYTFVWLVGLLIVNYLLPLGAVARIAITLLMALMTPDGQFTSYEKYRRWYVEHVPVGTPDRRQ